MGAVGRRWIPRQDLPERRTPPRPHPAARPVAGGGRRRPRRRRRAHARTWSAPAPTTPTGGPAAPRTVTGALDPPGAPTRRGARGFPGAPRAVVHRAPTPSASGTG